MIQRLREKKAILNQFMVPQYVTSKSLAGGHPDEVNGEIKQQNK
jgi:hypothetical protein